MYHNIPCCVFYTSSIQYKNVCYDFEVVAHWLPTRAIIWWSHVFCMDTRSYLSTAAGSVWHSSCLSLSPIHSKTLELWEHSRPGTGFRLFCLCLHSQCVTDIRNVLSDIRTICYANVYIWYVISLSPCDLFTLFPQCCIVHIGATVRLVPVMYFQRIPINRVVLISQWRHTRHDGVSNHQPHDCLLNSLFKA